MHSRLILIVTVLCSTAPSFALQPEKQPAPTPSAPQPDNAAPKTPPKSDDPADPNPKRDLTHYNLAKDKPAIEGYDPVAYFPEAGGKATKGKKELSYVFRGVTYYFATKENRDRFKKEPAKYEPTYGGWCATAIADGGQKVEIDPKNFKVTDGRLFLFYKGLFQNAKDSWNKDEKKSTTEADGWWKKIAAEVPRKPADQPKQDAKPDAPKPDAAPTPAPESKPKK